MYKLEFSNQIEKDFSKLLKDEARRILFKIESLANNPMGFGARSLNGPLKGFYRIRSENYRILHQIFDEKLIILVVRVSHRREVYR